MKVAYIAGPYRGRSKVKIINWLQRQANIRHAAKVAKWAWKEGYAVICPHKNSGNFDGLNTDLMFLNGDVEILKRCDVMILVPRWQQSEGTIDEISSITGFNDLKIPIVEARKFKSGYKLYPV
jgi:hypothetical protein